MNVMFEQAKKISAITSTEEVGQAQQDCTNLLTEGKISASECTELLQMVTNVTVRLTAKATQTELDKPEWERRRYAKADKPWQNTKGQGGTMWRFGGNGRKEQRMGVTKVLDVLFGSSVVVDLWHTEQDSQKGENGKVYDVRDELKDVKWAELANELYKAADTICAKHGIEVDVED